MENDKARELLIRISHRIIDAADKLIETDRKSRTEFDNGFALAYYEILDMLQSEIDIAGDNLSDFGLDVDLEAAYI